MVLALLFSLLTFSNYSVNVNTAQANPVFQTEWVKQKDQQQTVKTTCKPISVRPQLNQAAIEVEFSRTVRLRLSLLEKSFCVAYTNPIFLIQKFTSNYPSEEENNSTIG